MNVFLLDNLSKRRDELMSALHDGPVAVTDSSGRIFGYFLDSNAFALMTEIAEIAKDPELYQKTIAAYPGHSEITTKQAFSRR